MFQLVIVDNSGYEPEIVAVLPHQYATAAAGRADRDVIELHKPSDRFASWEVWSTDRITVRGSTPPGMPLPHPECAAELERTRALVKAARAWRAQFEKPADTKLPRMRALIDAIDELDGADLAHEVAQHQQRLRDRVRPKAQP